MTEGFEAVWRRWPEPRGDKKAAEEQYAQRLEQGGPKVVGRIVDWYLDCRRRNTKSHVDLRSFLAPGGLWEEFDPHESVALVYTPVVAKVAVAPEDSASRAAFERVLAKWPPFCPPDDPEVAWNAWRQNPNQEDLALAAEAYADVLGDVSAVTRYCKQLAKFARDPIAITEWKRRAGERISTEGCELFSVIWRDYPNLAAKDPNEERSWCRWWATFVSKSERFDFLCAMRAHLAETDPEYVLGFGRFVPGWKGIERGLEVYQHLAGPLRDFLGEKWGTVWPELSSPVRAMVMEGKMAHEVVGFLANQHGIPATEDDVAVVVQRATESVAR